MTIPKEKIAEWSAHDVFADPDTYGAPDCCRAHREGWEVLHPAALALLAEREEMVAVLREIEWGAEVVGSGSL